jgi:dsDNA-binding SOS-regulon protein
LEDIAVIYDDIRDVYRRNKYFVDKELADEFDKGVDNIMGELSNKLSSSSVEE